MSVAGAASEGETEKQIAERAVRDLRGVRGVSNAIVLQALVKPVQTTDVAARIEAALKRSAEIDAPRISVSAVDGKVTLTGNVRSWAEGHDCRAGRLGSTWGDGSRRSAFGRSLSSALSERSPSAEPLATGEVILNADNQHPTERLGQPA